MRSTLSVLVALLASLWIHFATAYPVILAIDDGAERCFQINIPEDDDVHIILLPVPDAEELEDDKIEIWYVQQVFEMTKQKAANGVLPNRLPDSPPDNVAEAMKEFLQGAAGKASPIKVRMNVRSFDGKKAMTNYRTKFFTPLVINRVSKVGRKLDDVEGAEICIQNMEEGESYHVIFDSILESEEVEKVEPKKPTFQKEEHLTPLEQSLEKSIQAARNVLKEMDYMENREKRMRVTSDSINTRVQWFSYLSIAILLVVTYVQVTYLRRYFHKKKLM